VEEARNLVYRIRAVADTRQAQAQIQNLVTGLGGAGSRIRINTDTSQARSDLRRLTGDIGSAGARAETLGSAFRRSFLQATDGGRSFSQSLRSGVSGAFDHASERATEFGIRTLGGLRQVSQGLRNPIQTIRNGFGNALQSVQGRFTRMVRGADDATEAIKRMGSAAGNARGNVHSLGGAAEASGSKFSALGLALPGVGVAATAAGAAMVGFAASSVSVGMDFDKAMSQVAATMGKSVKDLQSEVGSVDTTFGHFEGNLREYAQFMGSNTAFSATEAATALNYMALAGYDTEKSMSMLPTVLNLAAAGGIELAAASDMVTDAASALGLNTEQTAIMVDQMAMASSRSNTSVEQLGSAMLQVGGTAKVMAGGTKEIAQVLGVMADNGIKGAEGGTHLRNMLLKLSKPTKDGAAALKELGVEVFDAEGKMRAFPDIFQEMGSSLSKMTDADRLQTITQIFDSYDVAAVNALLGTSKDRWNELDGAIEKSAGAAARMAATQLDNLDGDVTLLKSAFEGVQIAVADRLMPGLRAITQVGGAALSGITAVLKNEQDELFSKTNMNATELAKAMFQVGGAANDLAGRGVEASVALGILADNGLKGAEGGAKLRDVIESIAQPTEAGSAALQSLGVDVKDAEGNMRGFSEIFPELNEALAGLSDDERRNAISAIFNTDDIDAANALLSTSKERWDELGQSAGSQSTNMSNAIATVTDMAGQGLEFAKTLAQGFAEGLPEVAAQLPLVLASVFDFLAENSPAMIEQGGELLTMLGTGIINAIPALLSNLPALIESIVGYIRAEAPALIQTGVELVLHLAGGILNALPDVVVAIVQIGGALLDAAMNIPGLLVDVGIAIVKGLWTGISETGSWLIGQFTGFLGGIVDSAKAFLGIASPSKVFAEMGDNMALGIGEGFGETIGGVIDFITSLLPTDLSMPDFSLPDFGSLFGDLPSLDDIGSFIGDLAEAGLGLVQTLADGIAEGLPMVLEVLFPLPYMAYEFFAGEAPTFMGMGLDTMVAMAQGVAEGIGQVLSAVAELASGILSTLASLPGEMVGIGTNIVQGVWQGISSAGGWLTSQVSGFFSNIVSNVKATLGIASPSKVFAEIGDNMALGVGKGFGESIGDVSKGIEKSMPKELEIPALKMPEIDGLPEETFKVIPDIMDVLLPDVPDVGFDVTPVTGEFKMPDFKGIFGGVKEMASSLLGDFVGPVMGDISGPVMDAAIPAMDAVMPVIGNDGEGSQGQRAAAVPFAPNISITVNGDASEQTVEDMKTSLYDTVKELFQEFREAEYERMALKNQYSFR